MDTTGDPLEKKHMNETFRFEDVPERFRTPFWDGVHKKASELMAESCTKDHAIDLLLSTAHDLLQAYRAGQIQSSDLHFLTECFNVAMRIYGEDLFDILDGDLYGVTEVFDHDDRADYLESVLSETQAKWTSHR